VAVKTADLTFVRDLTFSATTGSGRSLTFGDAPEDGLGPVETVLAALAACTAMDVISIALKKRQDVVAYRIRARGDQRATYPKVYTRIEIVHEIEGPGVSTEAVRRCIELSADRYCPVSAMLSAGPTEIHHRYRILRPGEQPDEGEVVVTGPGASVAAGA
jgi:putative redox protein